MEGQILLWIQDTLRGPFLDPVMTTVTHLGDAGIVWVVMSIVLLAVKRTRKVGLCCFLALLIMLIVNNYVIKILVDRTRPYEVVEGLTAIVPLPGDASFPSGHTAAGIAAAVVLIGETKARYWIPALLLALLVAFSRMYVGVHYPTDVLGGAILGILYGLAGLALGRMLWRRMQAKKTALPDAGDAVETETENLQKR
ncbi:MAG: phosphatase PAP2 family protein [Lachnospiraceae bacterium]|nr:phosphatase PAP2 family protein [Lachnospiraceae bacterium]